MHLENSSIRLKTMVLIVVATVSMTLLAALLILEFRAQFTTMRATQAKAALSAVMEMLKTENQRVLDGDVSPEEARARAAEVMRNLRYDDGEGYIAILDDDFVLVMHPINPAIEGVSNRDMIDADGRFIVQEAHAIGMRPGIGFNRYYFANPVTGERDVKTSAITRFDPWGWTLIAGVFDRRVDAVIADMTWRAVAAAAALLAGFILLALWVFRSIVRPVSGLTSAMTTIAGGAMEQEIPHTRLDNELGDMARALEVFRDNTRKMYVLKGKLEEALAQEKRHSAQQRQFVALVSHEFRTPLAIIDGSCGALERRWARMSEDKVNHHVTKSRRAVQRLIRLMESTLTAAKLEDGGIALCRTDYDLRRLLAELVEDRCSINSEVRFSTDLDGLPETISGDERLLYNVFDNLISNAVKYSPVDPKVDIRGWLDEDGMVRIAFSDNGVGIPPQELGKIGERFFRASTSTGFNGTGVGVNTVKLIAHLHGGDLLIESEVGVGSVFTVVLPVAEQQGAGGIATEAA